jgi:hypothetical protein
VGGDIGMLAVGVDDDGGCSTASVVAVSSSIPPLLIPATDDVGCDGGVVVFCLFHDGGAIDILLIFLCKV